VGCGVGQVKMCVTDFCAVWFTDCLIYIVVFNTDVSAIDSTRF